MKKVLGVSMGATLMIVSIPVLAGEPILEDRELDTVTAGTSSSYDLAIREDGQVIDVKGTYDSRADVVLKIGGVKVEIHLSTPE